MTTLRAEWTKLRTVPRWMLTLFASLLLTVLFGLLAASGSSVDANRFPDFVVSSDGQPVVDDFHFVHQPLNGDGTVIARVATQANSHEWAGAGVMVKQSLTSGSPYAALLVTPAHGVRFQSNFKTDLAGTAGAAPRWLKLTRSGAAVTGFESGDGVTWREVGRATLSGLPQAVEIGLFVSSPPKLIVERQAGSTSVGGRSTTGIATFDNVRLEAAQVGSWASDDVGREVTGPKGGEAPGGSSTESGGTFRVSGTGAIGPNAPADDSVQVGLFGVLVGLMAIIVVGVLFMTSEYKRGMIRTTFAASPGRVRVLAAKSVVLGVVTFGLGLVACVVTFLVTQPLLRDRGFAPPAFPFVSLSDGPVLRTIVGSAAFMALVAVFSLAVGTIMRHSATALTTVIGLVILPVIVAAALPGDAARWVMRLTLAGGFALQRSKPPNNTLVEPWSMLSHTEGFAVVCVYTVVAVFVAAWSLRRRDA